MEQQVLSIMRSVLGVDTLDEQVTQKNCPQWDSMHHLILVAELENTFDIELEPEEIADMTNFERVVAALKSKGVN